MRPGVVPVYRLPPATRASDADLPPPRSTRFAGVLPPLESVRYAELPPLGQGPLSGFAGPVSRPTGPIGQSVPLVDPRKLDRLQLSTWALLRSQQASLAGSHSLASGGQLGASQAGARLIYSFDRRLALAARLSSDVGRRGGEAAAGVRIQPLVSIPVWVTAERRQAVGKYGGGRSAFALFAESGIYDRPLPWQFSLDAYLQGGVVGLNSRDLFVDGGAWVTRPVYRNFSAGFGLWGGASPGLYRIDAGPRITMRVRRNLKLHLDWRQRLAGNARPGSGPPYASGGFQPLWSWPEPWFAASPRKRWTSTSRSPASRSTHCSSSCSASWSGCCRGCSALAAGSSPRRCSFSTVFRRRSRSPPPRLRSLAPASRARWSTCAAAAWT